MPGKLVPDDDNGRSYRWRITARHSCPPPNINFSGENFSGLSKYQTYMQASYTRAGENFKIIVESLKNALQGQERFFLPVSLPDLIE